MKNRQIMKDTITTTDLAAGGYMNEEQVSTFLRQVFDSTQLLQLVRTIMLKRPTMEIDKIGVGSRIMRGTTENEDVSSYTKKPDFGKIEINTKKYALPWEITEDFIEDNIEGKSADQTIADLFSTQMGLDTEDLAINADTISPSATTLGVTIVAGDTTITLADASTYPRLGTSGYVVIGTEKIIYEKKSGNDLLNCERGADGTTAAGHTAGDAVTWSPHPLVGIDNGWLKRMYTGGANYTDLSAISGGDIEKAHFFEIFRTLPQKYRRGSNKAALKWMLGSDQFSKWNEYLTERTTAAGDAIIAGQIVKPLGIPVIEAPAWPDDMIVLTNPKNLILAIWRQLKFKMTDKSEASVMRDVKQYNMTTRIGFEIEREDAIAFGDGLTTS